jgi:alkanesulfonate monooxygenase SsuD/methylene tetrahydromethanopterin reductase-like flavin-dependent oxidoreductase (luciferase family)
LLQLIETAVAAEELGADGAYFRVHHCARQLGSPLPLLSAIGAGTRPCRIATWTSAAEQAGHAHRQLGHG